MTIFALLLCLSLVILVVGQSILVVCFVVGRRSDSRPMLSDGDCPPAAVILSLRGDDPFLENCLLGLAEQDYPQFQVWVVVDSETDPAWATIDRLRSQIHHFAIQTLRTSPPFRSLKCSSLLQIVSQLDSKVGFIALLDADTIPGKTWLRQLASHLIPSDVGAATGIRWFQPQHPGAGNWLRQIWNAAAIVQMYCYQIPWGGTLAIKKSLVDQTDLIDRWGSAFCEDTVLYPVLRQHGYKVATAHELVMVNRESAKWYHVYRWICRQLLTARLYHPRWKWVAFHGLTAPILNLAALLLAFWSLANHHWIAGAWSLSGWLIFQGSNLVLLWLIAKNTSPNVSAAGTVKQPLGPLSAIQYLIIVGLAQMIHGAAVWHTIFLRRCEWRRITYKIKGPWHIEMDRYLPFPDHRPGSKNSSL